MWLCDGSGLEAIGSREGLDAGSGGWMRLDGGNFESGALVDGKDSGTVENMEMWFWMGGNV